MNNYIYNQKEGRLKTGWRILIFVVFFWLLSATIFLVRPLLGDITKREFLENYSVVIISVLAASASIAVFIARTKLDKLSWGSLGLQVDKRAYQDIVFGFFLSGFMAGLFFLVALLFNLIEFKGFNLGHAFKPEGQPFDFVTFMSVVSFGSMFILLVETILVGYWEELVFRGYLLQNMIAGMGFRIAIIISCLIYGLIHSMNPNATLVSSSIIVLFGYLRIHGYLKTNMLWLSMGMHIGWNFFQGPVFGFAASGHKKAALVNQVSTGRDWLSGGEFGPEGSILIVPILLIALLVMDWWTRGRKSDAL